MKEQARQNLIRILQNAHAGELAAGFAYRGHWKSVRNLEQQQQIKEIEAEEWQHRECVFGWLEKLEANPRKIREAVFWTVGRTLGLTCYISGWFFPMYFAGRLEGQNVQEYLHAAAFARELEMDDCMAEMLEMSDTERKHEDFFKEIVQGHFLLRPTKFFFRWG
jgi:demethoxyubiquinone hydroxylase (CLK1/Coq7/Cat5 family)